MKALRIPKPRGSRPEATGLVCDSAYFWTQAIGLACVTLTANGFYENPWLSQLEHEFEPLR
jgi:hypothetical protein